MSDSHAYNRPEARSRRRNRRRRTEAYRNHPIHEQYEDGRSSVSSRYVLQPLTPTIVSVDRSRPSSPVIQFDINVYYINLYICRLHFIIYIYISTETIVGVKG